jgi:DNA-directed RNA polymerase specialized sigma24 family protein
MNDMRTLGLLDRMGKPLPAHIEGVLTRLLPRLRRQFPKLQDDVSLIEVVEEAGRRICAREERAGQIEKLHGYAWVTLRSVATSHVRRGSIRLIQNTLEPEASREHIACVPAESGSAAQIERDILLREVLDTLTPEERLVCIWKTAGFSSEEIANFRGRSTLAVDKLFSRAKQKVRDALGLANPRLTNSPPLAARASTAATLEDAETERRDGGAWEAANRRRHAGRG